MCASTGARGSWPSRTNLFLPPGYYYDLDDSYDESDEEEVRAHLRCVAEQPPLKLDTSSEVPGTWSLLWGWAGLLVALSLPAPWLPSRCPGCTCQASLRSHIPADCRCLGVLTVRALLLCGPA